MTNAVANLSLTPHSGGGGGATKPEFTKYLGLPRVCPGRIGLVSAVRPLFTNPFALGLHCLAPPSGSSRGVALGMGPWEVMYHIAVRTGDGQQPIRLTEQPR